MTSPGGLIQSCLVGCTDQFYNNPNSQLADIVFFAVFLSNFLSRLPIASRYCCLWGFSFKLPLKIFKTYLLGRDSQSTPPPPFGAQHSRWHSFPSPIDVGLPIHPLYGPTSFGAQPPHWHIARCLSLMPFCNDPCPPLADIAREKFSHPMFQSPLQLTWDLTNSVQSNQFSKLCMSWSIFSHFSIKFQCC